MPISKSIYIVTDFETGSRNPYTTQPIEIASIAVNPRTLEIVPNSEFVSLIKPLDDKEALDAGLDPIDDEALKVNGKTREALEKAPPIKSVWKQYMNYISNYNMSGREWDAPVMVGFNNNGFDDIIIDRICTKKPWALGPVYEKRGCQGLFHPIVNIDIMKMAHPWFESNSDLKTISMDNLRAYFGMSFGGAHEALQDVKDEAEIFIRLMKLTRKFAQRVTFKDSFKINK